MTAASLVSTRSPERGGLVIGVEVHTESGDGPAHVNTDPIESARARAAARKTRLAADGIVDSSNPEYEFAQPGDAAQSRLNHAKRNPGNILFALGILFFATCVACVIVAVLRM
ncbi:MAG: hypothetical protein K8U57_01010 [Planctomycetes bacterium]|nr:hypothetical protein [Planctomycetota bacterium]